MVLAENINKSLTLIHERMNGTSPRFVIGHLDDHFIQQTTEDLSLIHNQLLMYLQMIETEHTFRHQFDLEHVKNFLIRYGLSVGDSEFESKIKDRDVIEAYDLTGNQIFRNLELFRYTSYSLVEIISRHWSELYLRPRLIDEMIMKEWVRVMELDSKEAVPLNVPPHLMKEKSGEGRQVMIRFKYAWLLRNEKGEKTGIMITQSASLIDGQIVSFI